MEKRHLVIICGEASGDLHAGNLATALKQINPKISISGVGGAAMRNAGVNTYCDIKGLSVIGLFDVFKKLPRFFGLKKLILEKIKSEKPEAIIFVDFSGFNLRLAKAINNTLPAIYYISPQVWASRRGRIKTIKKYIRKMMVIFKFEEEFYRRYGIDADFVGHPLLDIVRPSMEKQEFLKQFRLDGSWPIIALLPGSRKQEIENILPVMLKAALLMREKLNPVQFIIAKSTQVESRVYLSKIQESGLDLKIIADKTYDCLNAADFALVASGTATLETAIMQKPFSIIYKMTPLNYLFYRPQVKVPYIGMVNIVAQRKIIPEFIQYNARPEKIADYVVSALNDLEKLNRIKDELGAFKKLLGEKGASLKAAQIILDFLNPALPKKSGVKMEGRAG